MLILGTKPAQHDACFALIEDGVPLFIYEHERFNRIKHGMSSDPSVLVDALNQHGLRPADIDLVTNAIDPRLLPKRKAQVRRYLKGEAYEETCRYLEWRLPTWENFLLTVGFKRERIRSIRHHICHCAGVYYPSPFADAAILSVDGSGETETAMLAHGRDGQIDVLRTTTHPHSLGHFYQAATHWLGWNFGEEGKTMALAAYGSPRHYQILRDQVIAYDDRGDFAFADMGPAGAFTYSSRSLAQEVFGRLFGPERRGAEALEQHHKDVAASVQKICDEIMLGSARYLKERTESRNLLIAGGVGLNSVSNGLILREKLFEEMIVFPQANDTGTALGGGLYAYHNLTQSKSRHRWSMTHAAWGAPIDIENLDAAATNVGLKARRSSNIAEAAAARLAAGDILGWVQGRAEIGPRALGNRSILANPLIDGIKDRVNAKVKHRELWRPFAPSVLREEVSTYFEVDQSLPYMTVVANVRPEWRARLESIAHIDGTARVQTVTQEHNPAFWELIQAFRARTGLGMLLNTSFNDRGEPLVQTCEQAMELFLRSEMDALVIGDSLFTSKPPDRDIPPFAPYRFNMRKLPQGRILVILCEGVDLFVPMLQHIATEDRTFELRIAGGLEYMQNITGIAPNIKSERQFELGDSAAFDATVFCMAVSGDSFLFDRILYESEIAERSRDIVRRYGKPVFWIDVNGDVTRMNELLFAQHYAPEFEIEN